MAICKFIPLPSDFNCTSDPVCEFTYSALQLKALQQLYTEARNHTGETLSQDVLNILGIEGDVSRQDLMRIPREKLGIVSAIIRLDY